MRIALRTQQVIAYESGVADTVDPLAGSYYIEYLTNQIEDEATRYIEKIDNLGGATAAIEKGYMQREIVESAYLYQKEVESKDKVIVGVNEFNIEKEEPITILRVDPAVEERQIEKLNKIKRKRSSQEVKNALNQVYQAAEHNENLLPTIIAAVKKQATLGEICGMLKTIYGEYKAPTIF